MKVGKQIKTVSELKNLGQRRRGKIHVLPPHLISWRRHCKANRYIDGSSCLWDLHKIYRVAIPSLSLPKTQGILSHESSSNPTCPDTSHFQFLIILCFRFDALYLLVPSLS